MLHNIHEHTKSAAFLYTNRKKFEEEFIFPFTKVSVNTKTTVTEDSYIGNRKALLKRKKIGRQVMLRA